MSQPTNGSWNDGQGSGQGGSLGQNWSNEPQEGAQGGGSLGQNWGGQQEAAGQQYGNQSQADQGQSYDYNQQSRGQGYAAAQGQQSYDQQSYGAQQGQHSQQGYDQQQYGAAAAPAGGYNAPQSAGGGSPFSDTKFEQSLTPKIASLAFMLISAAAVLWGLTDIIHNFMGDVMSAAGSGGRDVTTKMHVFPAILKMLADVAIVGAVIYAARIVIELAVNVAKIAQRNKD